MANSGFVSTARVPYPWDDDSASEDSLTTEVKRLLTGGSPRPLQGLRPKRAIDVAYFFLPCLRWLRTYDVRANLVADLIAGLSVGAMVVPQGMSYANLAGLPSVFGLYGAFIPCIVYSLLGSSRQLAVGPVAVTSLLISTGLKDIVPEVANIQNPNSVPEDLVSVQEQYNHLAIQLSFLVACLYTAVGVLRLGFLTNFLSHSVISGFTSGAAIIIGLSQVKYLFGISVPRRDAVHEQLKSLFDTIEDFKWREYVMGVSLLLMLVILKRVSQMSRRLAWVRAVGPLAVCVFGIVLVSAANVDQYEEINTIKSIPAGLPSVTIPWWFPMPKVGQLFKLGIIVMMVDLLESTSIAKSLARRNNYEIAPNQEIVGLGISNFAGSIFHSYTTTGSFSRSAVNNDVGAKTPLAQFVCGLLVMFVLLFLTPVFKLMPYNCLAAVIIIGVATLVDLATPAHYFKVNKKDFLVWIAAFFGTMFAGVEIGLAIAVGLAVLLVIYESAFPHTAVLGRIPGTTVYRNVHQYPNAEQFDGMLLYRVDAPLYFANVNYVRDQLRHYIAKADGAMQFVVLEMSPMTHIDATGLAALSEIIKELKDQGIQLALANPSASVIRKLELDNISERLGKEWIFVRIHDAVQYCQGQTHFKNADASEQGAAVHG